MTASDAPFEVKVCLKRVLKSARISDGVARGLNEVLKKYGDFRREAYFCVFAKNCDEAAYEKLVRALCHSHKIPIIEIEDKAELGEMLGQCKYDKEGKARKVVGCSCAVVKNYGRDDGAQLELEEYFKKQEKTTV